MYPNQQPILTPQDETYMAQFLMAFIKKFSDHTVQIRYSLTDIMKMAAVTYINEPIELTQGLYFTIYMVCDDRNDTIMPGIMMGVSKQDIDTKLMNLYASDIAVHLQPISITELDMTRQVFKERTSTELGTTNIFAPFMRDPNYLYNIIKFIFEFEYNEFMSVLMMYMNSPQSYNAFSNSCYFFNNRLYHNGRRYEFRTGPVFILYSNNGIITFGMEMIEAVNREAKNDRAFHWRKVQQLFNVDR